MAPNFHLFFTQEGIRAELALGITDPQSEEWVNRFNNDMYQAIYDYGLQQATDVSAVAHYICKINATFLKKLTDLPELELMRENVKLEWRADDYDKLLRALPFALGAEFVTRKWLKNICKGLLAVYQKEIASYEGSVSLYFEEKQQNLHVPERIFFHLVENKNEDFPFAFMATYASRQGTRKASHYPLRYALTEYEHDRTKLLELLSCLNKAAEASSLIAEFMMKGELFHPLKLTAQEAYSFLRDVPAIEESGILCRIPKWWRSHASSPRITMILGENQPSAVGAAAILSSVPQITVDGTSMTKEDIQKLLEQTEGLANLKGKWVEVNHNKLQALLDHIDSMGGDISLMQALKKGINEQEETDLDEGILVENGAWLADLLHKLRNPKEIPKKRLPKDFIACLRPYQKTGFQWLSYMGELGFGACLADDMGLGKTIQILAYLELLRKEKPDARNLLIVPASLLGNWQKEAEKFAPKLPVEIFHGRSSNAITKELSDRTHEELPFLSITTYGMAQRISVFQEILFDCLILDEAQAIKNPGTKQTKTIKKIQSRQRIAMTGTPIENDLGNLWSLFDFLNKGLLGTSTEFRAFSNDLQKNPENYEKLRAMISPFLLRRLKTDKSIIKDLPEKMEMLDYSELTTKQVVLYRKVVSDLEKALDNNQITPFERRGLVLASIMKLKQICNHPDQYLDGTGYLEEDSGKMALLRNLCETIREKRERVLIFTQFTEIIPHLQNFLTDVFGRKGFTLSGQTPVKERTEIVNAFQGDAYVPFLILSVRAGGTGLTLTKANHVIHFDRWWNPAVENQATDRAYRIGQKSNVMVHKLVCKNTIEERIDSIINNKKELADNIIGSAGENWITELSNEQLMNLLRLS